MSEATTPAVDTPAVTKKIDPARSPAGGMDAELVGRLVGAAPRPRGAGHPRPAWVRGAGRRGRTATLRPGHSLGWSTARRQPRANASSDLSLRRPESTSRLIPPGR
jgi:hypothetical protein